MDGSYVLMGICSPIQWMIGVHCPNSPTTEVVGGQLWMNEQEAFRQLPFNSALNAFRTFYLYDLLFLLLPIFRYKKKQNLIGLWTTNLLHALRYDWNMPGDDWNYLIPIKVFFCIVVLKGRNLWFLWSYIYSTLRMWSWLKNMSLDFKKSIIVLMTSLSLL